MSGPQYNTNNLIHNKMKLQYVQNQGKVENAHT